MVSASDIRKTILDLLATKPEGDCVSLKEVAIKLQGEQWFEIKEHVLMVAHAMAAEGKIVTTTKDERTTLSLKAEKPSYQQ